VCSRLASSNSETDGSILYGCVLFIAFEWARVCGSCAGRRFMIGFGSNQSVILVFTMVKRRRTAIVSLPRNDNNGSFVPLAMEEETTKSHPDVVPAAACGGEDSCTDLQQQHTHTHTHRSSWAAGLPPVVAVIILLRRLRQRRPRADDGSSHLLSVSNSKGTVTKQGSGCRRDFLDTQQLFTGYTPLALPPLPFSFGPCVASMHQCSRLATLHPKKLACLLSPSPCVDP
jgi:hypothetical protein